MTEEPTGSDGLVNIDTRPTPEEEYTETFSTERERRQRIINDSEEQNVGERKRYAEHAYGITQAWIGFLMVLTMAEFSLKSMGMGLGKAEFIAVFTTTTASVFGYWLLVGQYLFRSKR